MRRPHSPRAPLLAAAKTQELVRLFLSGAQEGGVRGGTSGFATPRWSLSRFSSNFLLIIKENYRCFGKYDIL